MLAAVTGVQPGFRLDLLGSSYGAHAQVCPHRSGCSCQKFESASPEQFCEIHLDLSLEEIFQATTSGTDGMHWCPADVLKFLHSPSGPHQWLLSFSATISIEKAVDISIPSLAAMGRISLAARISGAQMSILCQLVSTTFPTKPAPLAKPTMSSTNLLTKNLPSSTAKL
mmetsp:Transcript_156544/g.288682  ORF Transcript_156544/g.288682 Transcript_156544/m.288682 type:complete len:169 (-) Transcript_156544:266-772(-)